MIDKSAGPNGAWRWLGSRQQANGYPQFTFTHRGTGRRVTRNVHRLQLCIREGRELARTEYALHDRGCPKWDVNPRHLRIGTQQENLDDAKAEKCRKARLSEFEVRLIIKLFDKDGLGIHDIADRLGVSNQTVIKVCRGETHRKITKLQRRTIRREKPERKAA
jgi:hypothetical protein